MKTNQLISFFREKFRKLMLVHLFTFFLLMILVPGMADTYAQNKISINAKSESLKNIFTLIQNQCECRFLYSSEDVNPFTEISMKTSSEDLSSVLDKLLRGTGLVYSINGNIIFIKRSIATDTVREKEYMLLTGVVMDRDSLPLPGVTVIIKGTNTGVGTDAKGQFRMEIEAKSGCVLVVSFVGMKTREIRVGKQTRFKIILEEDVKAIEEVMVTGYQSIQRRDMVGAYTTVKAADIMKPAYTSIDQMLQGQIAGLMVMNTSSRVGTRPKIQIRGASTILGNQDPLWVVDGIIQPDPIPMTNSSLLTEDLKNILGNQISWLNPSDIETITVLKDASATAIYGAKASNGVIVITTKRGKADRLSVGYSGNFSFRARPTYKMFNLMNSQERIDYSKEAFDLGVRYIMSPRAQLNTYEGLTRLFYEKKISLEEYAENMRKLETTNTDWLDILTRDAFSHNHNLSLMGGSSKFSYNASIGFSDEKGVEIGNGSKRMTARLRVGADLLPTLKVDISLVGTMGRNTGFGPNVNPIGYATSTSRAIRAFDDNGDRLFYRRDASYGLNDYIENGLGFNIMNEIDNSYSKAKNSSIQADLNLNWDLLPWLSYQLVMGISENNVNSRAFAGERTFHVANRYRGYDWGTQEPGSNLFKSAVLPFGGELFTSDTKLIAYNIQNKILIQKTFKEVHRINVMLATEVRSTDNTAVTNSVWGYSPERGDKIVNPTDLDKLVPMNGSEFEWWKDELKPLYRNGDSWVRNAQTQNYFSLFATLAYSFNNRYVLNANIRNDASNRFGQDQNKRFDPNYSFGISWRMAEENFVKENLSWLNQLNFRATFGIQGNAVNSVSPDMIVGQVGVLSPFNEYGVGIRSLPNPKLSWERTKTWNLGFDLELFNGITMNLEYYRRSSDALVSQAIPQEYGMESMNVNGGRVVNHGVEYTLNITPFKRENIAWTVGFNISKNWNKTTQIEINKFPMDLEYLNGGNGKVLKSGYPMSAFWAYSYAGLNHDTGLPEFNLFDQEPNSLIDPAEYLVYAGHTDPSLTGGVNTRIRYKGLSFGANFAMLLGAKKRLPNIFPRGVNIPDEYQNLDKDLTKRWRKPGDEAFTDIPGIYAKGDNKNTITTPDGFYRDIYTMWSNSDARVVSGSFLRCTQMSLTWNVNPEWTRMIGLKDLAFQATANNIFVIASKKFNGFDPELGNSIMPRTYSFGINIGF